MRLLMLVPFALVLAGCTSEHAASRLPPTPRVAVTPIPVPSTAAPAWTACDASGASLSAGLVDAALGTRGLTITLLNCGRGPYRLDGRPALRLLDDRRRPVPVTEVNGTRSRALTLRPGEKARFALIWRNTVTSATDPAVTAPYIEVVPAPGRPPHVLAVSGGVDLGTTGRVEVNGWRR